MDPGRRRHRDRRHFGPCAGGARRHRLRRSARSRKTPGQGPGSRGRRIREGRLRRLRPCFGRGDRGQCRDRRQSGGHQPRSRGRRLVLQAQARRHGRARRLDGRGRLSRVGEDALKPTVISTSKWDPADYATVGGFVAELGQAALDLLDPQPGEHILDVGCGDGTLTIKIVERGATVVGIDNSLEMIGAAREKGLDARLMDAADMKFSESFDAAFSNATLHWVLDKERAARAIWFALKPSGRFAGEMGGEGNIRKLREALDEELILRGYPPPVDASNWYASPEEFAEIYERVGFREIDARLIERPTPIDHGIAAWVTTFRKGWLDRAGVPDDERAGIAAAVADHVGSNVADYVRLRFIMRKPD